MMGVVIAGIVGLLFVSALLTAAETAAFKMSASRVRTLKEEGFRGAGALSRLRSEPGRIAFNIGASDMRLPAPLKRNTPTIAWSSC